MAGWENYNPRPELPKTRCREGESKREYLLRITAEAYDYDGPSPEWQEYEEAKKVWQHRHETAERKCGVTAANALQEKAGAAISEAVEGLANIRATTIRGLQCNARIAVVTDEDANAE
jgi:hypothetical protein